MPGMMSPRERVLTALDHREPDRVPFDLGSSFVTGIHHVAYRNLRRHLGLVGEGTVADLRLGLAHVDDDVRRVLRVDAGLVGPQGPSSEHWRLEIEEVGEYRQYHDEYGLGWRSPRDGGLYFDLYDSPLRGDITAADIDRYPWPDLADSHRYEKIRTSAHRVVVEEGRAAVFRGVATGIFQLASWMRGHEQFFMDMLTDRPLAEALLEKAVEIKIAGWERIFAAAGEYVDVTYDSDDYGTQRAMFISPDMWRQLIKPRLARLHDFIHRTSGARVFYHSCGAIRPIIPDLIEVGVDALNPIQVSAAGMDTLELKREFGREITFWGGGVDTQHVLPHGTPSEVRDEVQRRISDLMPGGGFVFTTVHNIQPDVPAENIMAMWQALREFGVYAD